MHLPIGVHSNILICVQYIVVAIQAKHPTPSEIDFVVLWVDGADPEWRRARNRFLTEHESERTLYKEESGGDCRFREWGTFRHFFRALEANVPWFRKLHLVTAGHLPSWLNLDHPKLHTVRHEDIFEVPEHLPTFNTNAIHANIDRIAGLTEHFVLFDDDLFILQPTPPTRFFGRNLPKDHIRYEARLVGDELFGTFIRGFTSKLHEHFRLNKLNMLRLPLISPNYDLRLSAHNVKYYLISLLTQREVFYTPLSLYHFPQPLLLRCVREAKAAFADDFAATSAHRFRQPDDLSAYFFRYWQILTGQFIPEARSKECKYLELRSCEEWVKKGGEHLRNGVRFACLNDTVPLARAEEERLRSLMIEQMESIFPHKSSFEI